MVKGEAFLKHYTSNKSITLKKWAALPSAEKNEFSDELHFANIEGELKSDVFGDELKKGAPVYKLKGLGLKVYCLPGNYFKLTDEQKAGFETSLSAFPGPEK